MFNKLLLRVTPTLERGTQIEPEAQLMMVLRYLASGNSMADLQYQFLMSPSSILKIVPRVCKAIWDSMQEELFEAPSPELWQTVAAQFEEKWQFPNCCDAIDGKHNIIVAFPNTGAAFYNYKSQHSIVLMAVADAAYRLLMVDVGARGRRSDGGIFHKCTFGKMLLQGQLGLPAGRTPANFNKPLPYCFVGDGAFPMQPSLMKPYPGEFLPMEDNLFNYRLSRARRIVENGFGILSSMWRILRRPIQANRETVELIVLASCALHNFHCKENIERYINEGLNKPVDMTEAAIKPMEAPVEEEQFDDQYLRARKVRRDFTEYFIANPLPWQWE